MAALTTVQLIQFEQDHPDQSPRREEAIRAELGVTPARYYQLLLRAIHTEEALRLDPVLVHRLRRKWEAGRRSMALRNAIGPESWADRDQ